MSTVIESRHALAGLSDELIRMRGRLKGLFAGARRSEGLSDSELMVLSAVVGAELPPTAPQIARSLGQPRQLVLRAANSLAAQDLIEPMPNPDHKRAALLRATERGVALKREIDDRVDDIAGHVAANMDLEAVERATVLLREIRKDLEARLRAAERRS